MHLEADQVVVDDTKQISTFTGKVQLSQGTMLMHGDKIIVTQDTAGNQHITITGDTAHFRQKREGLEEYVESDAQRIEYDTRAEVVDFYGNAQMKRELDDVRGEHIRYNLKTEIFQVNSGITAPNALPKRVRAVLQPKKDKVKTPAALPIRSSPALSPTE
jgi:lipopolysaccharide export system protein LptA